MDRGGTIRIFVVFIEPLFGVEMRERNPILLALQPWVELDRSFYAMLMVSLKAKERWTLALVLLELVTHTLHCVIVAGDVALVGLRNNRLGLAGIVAVQALHVCTVTKVNYIVGLDVIQELSEPSEALIADLWGGMGAGVYDNCLTHLHPTPFHQRQ